MEVKYNYLDVIQRLCSETAVVVFMKRNGELRAMLCTRNIFTLRMFGDFLGLSLTRHDGRCNIKNGNISVIDLEISEARSFGIDRVLHIEWCGVIEEPGQLDKAAEMLEYIRNTYSQTSDSSNITLDNMNEIYDVAAKDIENTIVGEINNTFSMGDIQI